MKTRGSRLTQMATDSYIPLLGNRRVSLRFRLRLESWEYRLTALERRFRVHLVPYVAAEVSDSLPRELHLCRLYKKAMYSRRLAGAVQALQRSANGKIVIVAYQKPWQRELRDHKSSRQVPSRPHSRRAMLRNESPVRTYRHVV